MKLDNKDTLLIHKNLILKKIVLRKTYENFYNQFLKIKVPKGKKVELGSGAGFLKKWVPDVITSDVVKGPEIDKVFFAEKMPFKNKSLSAIYMLNVLHHIKDPQKALKEMQRCLKKGGKIIMIEPYNSLFSKFFYTHFHHEAFDVYSDWKIKGKGRLSDANGAIPWIIFVRDKEKFRKLFPGLKVKRVIPHTPLSYLVSGGLSKRQLIPNFFFPLISQVENIVSPFNSFIGMFVTIEVEKINK